MHEALEDLAPSVEELKLTSGTTVEVRKAFMHFREWARKDKRGKPVTSEGMPINTFGGKQILNFRGKPVFAELAILRTLRRKGWDGVWVYGYRGKFRTGMLDKPACDLPEAQEKLYSRIKASAGLRGGCWDVFAWRGKEFLFAEAKRTKRDRIRQSQRRWLEAALEVGLPLTSFLVVEWDVEPAVA